MTIASAVMNNINNLETMLSPDSSEIADVDFSDVLDNQIYTLGDLKNKFSNETDTDKLSDFKEFLTQITSEVNVETSLDLTLAKDAVEPVEPVVEIAEPVDAEKEKTEETAETDENNIILFSQVFETANQEIQAAPELQNEVSEAIDFVETAPEKAETPETKPECEAQEISIDEDMLEELNIEAIKAETDSANDNSSLLNRQTPEEQGIKIALNHEGANEVKSFEVQTPVKTVEITPSKIIEQVTKHLETLQNTSKVSIVLNPETLGKVTIQLVKSPEGLSAQFTTATQEARNLLMKGLDGLKETLTAHGVGVDNVSVKVNDTQKSEYNADWTEQEGSRGGNKEQNPKNKREKEEGLFERMMKGTRES